MNNLTSLLAFVTDGDDDIEVLVERYAVALLDDDTASMFADDSDNYEPSPLDLSVLTLRMYPGD